MNVLFLVPEYQNLYRPIVKELENKGYKVYVIFDKLLKNDPYFNTSKINKYKRKLKNIFISEKNIHDLYWKNYIQNNYIINNYSFDIFFCINGYSLSPILINILKEKNKNIKTVLYLWDTNNYYNFNRHLPYFDRAFSFDWLDCKYNNKLTFLPFYWVEYNNYTNENKYIMSIIGTNHDNRFYIVNKIAQVLKQKKLNFYFKLFKRERDYTIRGKILYIIYTILGLKNKLFDLKLRFGKIKSELFTTQTIPQEEVVKIMSESEYILDTDRESQTGTTPRLIWALALNKKIITTNTNIKKLPFYDEKQIYIIDRNNPNIDFIFNKINNSDLSRNEYIDHLKIDQWVNNFINI